MLVLLHIQFQFSWIKSSYAGGKGGGISRKPIHWQNAESVWFLLVQPTWATGWMAFGTAEASREGALTSVFSSLLKPKTTLRCWLGCWTTFVCTASAGELAVAFVYTVFIINALKLKNHPYIWTELKHHLCHSFLYLLKVYCLILRTTKINCMIFKKIYCLAGSFYWLKVQSPFLASAIWFNIEGKWGKDNCWSVEHSSPITSPQRGFPPFELLPIAPVYISVLIFIDQFVSH